MTEHEVINSEDAGLPAGGYYVNMSSEEIPNPEAETVPTEGGQKAAAEALAEVHGRSFSGRNPHLGRMIKCQVCGMRHRVNERTCVQRFATTNREGDPVQGELVPPEGLTHLTAKQVYGAAMFAKKRIRPHSNRYLQARINKIVAKQRKEKEEGESNAKEV
jgi:hypothetical protein